MESFILTVGYAVTVFITASGVIALIILISTNLIAKLYNVRAIWRNIRIARLALDEYYKNHPDVMPIEEIPVD